MYASLFNNELISNELINNELKSFINNISLMSDVIRLAHSVQGLCIPGPENLPDATAFIYNGETTEIYCCHFCSFSTF